MDRRESEPGPRRASLRPFPFPFLTLVVSLEAIFLALLVLSIVLGLLFAGAFLLHAASGAEVYNREKAGHGRAESSLAEYLVSSRFWFESLQNGQSEFLSIWSMVGPLDLSAAARISGIEPCRGPEAVAVAA